MTATSQRTVVVTGGSRGIGMMIARGFVAAGDDVVISSRKAEACHDAAAELVALGSCTPIPADLATDDGVEALATAMRERTDRVDVLVNNAGATWGAPVDDYPTTAFDKVFAVNVRGVFGLTQALLPALRAATAPDAPARVINIGSVDGLRVPFMDNYAYSASKSALHALTRHLALRLATDGVTVNAIAPGPFPSKMMASVLEDSERRSEVLARVPLGRLGHPDDVAGMALFLAGPAATWVTGAIVPLDGGMSLGG